jgi:hypothetical protein
MATRSPEGAGLAVLLLLSAAVAACAAGERDAVPAESFPAVPGSGVEGSSAAANDSAASPAESPVASTPNEDDAVAALLFATGDGGLSMSEQREIVSRLNLSAAADQGGTLIDGVCGAPVETTVHFEDLNRNGVSEVRVEVASICLFGGTGVGTTLFVRDGSGRFRANLGFPGLVTAMLSSQRGGFPDLRIGGMGFCEAIWGWDGSEYVHIRNEPQEPGGCN